MRYSKTITAWFISRSSKTYWSLGVGRVKLLPSASRREGGTTLNHLPIGLHVKILNFNGRFEAYWATFGMLSWYQSVQNRWKFNICFNVWVVVGIDFAVRARKQRPPCF